MDVKLLLVFAMVIVGLLLHDSGLVKAKEVPRNDVVAILKDGSSKFDDSTMRDIQDHLVLSGIDAQFIDYKKMRNDKVFNINNYELLILPGMDVFAAEVVSNLLEFLEQGGHLIVLGGPSFQEPQSRFKRGEEELELEALSPAYKLFPVSQGSVVEVESGQVFVEAAAFPMPEDIFSSVARPQRTGFLKNRDTSFIPLIGVYDEEGMRTGYLCWMVIKGGYRGTKSYAGSSWVCFGTNDQKFYRNKSVQNSLVSLVIKMLNGVYLWEGGAKEYAYFSDTENVALGAVVARTYKRHLEGGHVRISVEAFDGEVLFEQDFDFETESSANTVIGNIDYAFFQGMWNSSGLDESRYLVKTELIEGEEIIDRVAHEINIWRPKSIETRNNVTVKDGDFYLNDKLWRIHGINYVSSHAIANTASNFDHWLAPQAYDPDLIEEDLQRIARLGVNVVSTYIKNPSIGSMNLLDFFVRAERNGIFVNMFVPYAHPLQFSEAQFENVLDLYRLRENDNVFAYDIAWEPYWGYYSQRKVYDEQWMEWILERYGSVSEAEEDWEYACPRADGKITAPSDTQFQKDGPWRRMIAAYRRFMDDFLGKHYIRVVNRIRELDPDTLISFRMSCAGDPTVNPECLFYDFKAVARAVDFMQPEGYGRVGEWENVRAGAFTAAYARYAAPGKPVVWAEFGKEVWNGTNFNVERENQIMDIPAGFLEAISSFNNEIPKMQAQKNLYENFFKMVFMSYANGTSPWWYPGGYQAHEKSDYGVFNPDGSYRPAAYVLAESGKRLLELGPVPKSDYWITIDRDADARGIYGMYSAIQEEFWNAIDSGKFPGLKDEGVGTTSIDTPLVAVGNTVYNGNNPPKYLNAVFDKLEVKDSEGVWVDVISRNNVTVVAGQPIYARATIENTQTALWIAPVESKEATGTVYLASRDGSDIDVQVGIVADTAYLETATIPEFSLVEGGIAKDTTVILQMNAKNRMWFGEKAEFVLQVK